jgi:WhiB family redox-sensing transcriptional regulator
MSHQPDRRGTEDHVTPTSWMAYARCRDVPPRVFFPRDGVGVAVAQQYCAVCPVAGHCLDYALENHIEHGVWGGASERKRRRLTRYRRRSEVMGQGTAATGRAGGAQGPVADTPPAALPDRPASRVGPVGRPADH